MARWKRRVLWVIVVVLVLPTVYLVGNRSLDRYAGERRLAAVLAELDATDPGWRLDDILAAREKTLPPDDENITRQAMAISESSGDLFKDWVKQIDGGGVQHDEGFSNHLLPPDALVESERLLDRCRSSIARVRRIRCMSRGGYSLDVAPNVLDTKLPHIYSLRWAGEILRHDVIRSASAGDGSQPIHSTHAILNTAAAIGDEPFLISMVARIACEVRAVFCLGRTLAWTEPRDGMTELQAALIEEADAPLLIWGLRGERAMYDRLYEAHDTGAIDRGKPVNKFDLERAVGDWLFRGKLPGDRATYLRWTTDMLRAARHPLHERRARMSGIPLPDFTNAPLAKLLLPAVGKVGEADHRAKSLLRSAAAGIACERFRQKHGRWPKELAEIPKDILPAVPLDPYDGQPLRYRPTDDGVIVYSVGPDAADDGGRLNSGQPKPGDDVGFRLWDVPHRRAAPPPQPADQDRRGGGQPPNE